VLREARRSAEPTHDHPEGINGAEATALCIRMALDGRGKPEIKRRIAETNRYDLSRSLDAIREHHGFDVTCQGTVPPAIIAFLESRSYEDAVRKAVFLGGDSDTLACIAGSIAEAFYREVPELIIREVVKRLTMDLLGILRDGTARQGTERTRRALLPMFAARAKLEAVAGLEFLPTRINKDCIIVRVAGADRGLNAEAVCNFIRTVQSLRYGTLVLDFEGRDPGAAGGEIASLLVEAAASCIVLVVNPAPSLASALQPKLPKNARVLAKLDHAVNLADLLAARAVEKVWD
ncbi:MAG: ADP-ribosylglycohydrolase family protein, partial [Spirochaetes bacterium]|nr:ADP-ribosylglycohydrolase family protein [Spirochaetota bacterium]